MDFRVSKFAIAIVFVLTAGMSAGFAQQPSESHLAAARKAIVATKATEAFDNILLESAQRIKDQLIGTSPDQVEKINAVVDEEAIALAVRRGDLEAEAARLFANAFTEAELIEITAFYNSPTGQKYLASTPILARELGKAARVWAGGINRDLTDAVTKKMLEAENQ